MPHACQCDKQPFALSRAGVSPRATASGRKAASPACNEAIGQALGIEGSQKTGPDGKGEVFLANDTTPNYTDTTPFPATPAKWTYRAIFRVGDSRVGQWSKPVSVTVGG